MSPRPAFSSLLTCLALLIGSFAWSAPPEASDNQRTDRYGDPLPPGAIARMGSVLFYHDQAPSLLAFSPDGKILAVAGCADNSFRALHASIRLLDAATGRQLRRLLGHRQTHSLRFSEDGKLLISSGRDSDGKAAENLKIWDVATGIILHCLNGDALTRDGKTLIVIDPQRDNTIVRFSEVATGKLLREIAVPQRLVWKPIVFAPDGNTFAGIIKDDVYIWDVATGKVLHHLPVGVVGQNWLYFSPDGKTLAACLIDKILLWDVASGKELNRWEGFSGISADTPAFSADSKTLAFLWKHEAIHLWNIALRKEMSRIPLRDASGFMSLAFAPDGKTLAWGDQKGHADDGLVHLWDLAAGKERLPAGRLPESITLVAFSPNGKKLLTMGHRDEPLRYWDTDTGRELRMFKKPANHSKEAISSSGRLLATAGKTLQIWNLSTRKEIVLRGRLPKYSVETLAFPPDDQILAVGADRTIRFWDTKNGEELSSFGKAGLITNLVFTADSKKVLALSLEQRNDLSIKVWNVDSGKLIHKLHDPGLAIHAPLAVSSDGRILATISHRIGKRIGKRGETVEAWIVLRDLTTGKSIREWGPAPQGQVLPGSAGETSEIVSGLAFSPDDRTLACVYSGEGVIRLWETATGQERRHFEGHRQYIRCLAFSADGSLLATGADDHTALVWDVTGRLDNGPVGWSDLSADELRALWTDLDAKDVAIAYRAMCRLLAGRQTVAFLRQHVKPLNVLTVQQREQMKRWIADLDHAEYEKREKAAAELEKMGEVAEPALRAALADKPSLESRLHMLFLIEKLDPFGYAQAMQEFRAIEVLEHIATPEARELLQALAEGEPAYRLTREAKASLNRLASRSKRQQ